MKKISKSLASAIIIFLALFGFCYFAKAATPVLSVSSIGSGDNVQINVVGDPNVSVLLFANSQLTTLGTTNASGSYITTVSSATVVPGGIAVNAIVYVKTGGLSGTQSNSVSWPYFQASTTDSTITLSQSALLLNAGQTSTITASANFLYLLSNSNPTIANLNFNAGQITVQALTYGTTLAKVCVVGGTTNCATINITVQTSSTQQLTFSQNNFSIYSGQNIPITVSGGSGSYLVSNNSNSNAVQTSLNGSTITLSSNNTNGTASITVCTTDMTRCGILNVNSTTVNSTAVTFSQTNPVVSVGQTVTVTIFGGTGTNFYVSSNSNPSIVQANINSNILTLIGNASTGNSSIVVCAYAGSCATLTATVSSGTTGGPILLSQNSLSILAGQSTNITISGGSTPYTISPASNSTFQAVISGNILTIYGVNAGSATANVCASVGCATLSLTISNTTSLINPPTFSQNNISMTAGQQTTVNVSGNSGYYVANNTNTSATSVMISGDVVIVSGTSAGTSNISVCQTGGQCATLYVTVNLVAAPVVTPTPVLTPAYILSRYLGYGDRGDDVLQLQKLLVEKGFLTATPNGYYGAGTMSAIKKFQKANGIKQLGNIGPSTLNALNKIFTSKESQISTVQQAIQQLLAQIAQLQGR